MSLPLAMVSTCSYDVCRIVIVAAVLHTFGLFATPARALSDEDTFVNAVANAVVTASNCDGYAFLYDNISGLATEMNVNEQTILDGVVFAIATRAGTDRRARTTTRELRWVTAQFRKEGTATFQQIKSDPKVCDMFGKNGMALRLLERKE